MRNTVVVDMTNGGALTAWDSVAESENTINLLVHTGAGANPKIYLENRTTSGTITGFDANSIYFYQIPAAYIPEYEFGADNRLYVTLSDDTQTAETIRFLFNADTGGQMTIQKDAGGRQFFCSYQKIMTDAEVNEVIQQAQTTIEQLPQTITTTASSSTVANNVNSFNLDGIFESIMTNIKPVLLKKANGSYVYVNTPPSNGIRNYISIKENYIQFIEAHLPSGTSFAEGDTTAFTLGGQQVYYTSIDGGSAYKNLTFTSPTVLNGSSVDVSLYAVRIPTPTATYIKSQYKWTYDSTLQSYVVDLIFGVGDNSGNGQAIFSKVGDMFKFFYKSRTQNGAAFGVGMDDTNVYDIFAGAQFGAFVKKEYPTLSAAQADTSLPDGVYAVIVAGS